VIRISQFLITGFFLYPLYLYADIEWQAEIMEKIQRWRFGSWVRGLWITSRHPVDYERFELKPESEKDNKSLPNGYFNFEEVI
jgi:hypothetical protein